MPRTAKPAIRPLPNDATPEERSQWRLDRERRRRELAEAADREKERRRLEVQSRLDQDRAEKEERKALDAIHSRHRERIGALIVGVGGIAAAGRRWGVSKSVVAGWRDGTRPNYTNLVSVARCERISIDWLCGFDTSRDFTLERQSSVALATQLLAHIRTVLVRAGIPRGALDAFLPSEDRVLKEVEEFYRNFVQQRRNALADATRARLQEIAESRLQAGAVTSPEELALLRVLRSGELHDARHVSSRTLSQLVEAVAYLDGVNSEGFSEDDLPGEAD